MYLYDMAPAAQCNFKIREELILHYLPMADKYAKMYESDYCEYDDLYQIAAEAIINAIDGGCNSTNAHISTIIANNVSRTLERYCNDTKKVKEQEIDDEDNDIKNELIDIIGQLEDDILHEELLSYLKKTMDRVLTPREEYTITMQYGLRTGEPLTLEAVGKTLNITRARVREINSKSLRKLKATDKSTGKLLMFIKEL